MPLRFLPVKPRELPHGNRTQRALYNASGRIGTILTGIEFMSFNALKRCAACITATIIGALPGAFLAYHSDDWHFLGIALIGGLIGFGIGISSVVYKTTIRGTMRRAFRGWLHTMLSYNLGFLGEKIVPLDGETPAHDLVRGPNISADNAALTEQRGAFGGKFGSAAIGVLAIPLTIFYFPYDEPGLFYRIIMPFFTALLGGAAGFVYGTAIAILTVSGRHRRNVVIGALVGILLGVSLGIATGEGAKSPESYQLGLLVVLTTICTAAGTFASENYPRSESSATKAHEPEREKQDLD